MSEPVAAKPIVCYLTCPRQKNVYVGAVLVTDGTARPLHFAHASPVQPTAMQRILYGNTLDEHVRVDVIARQLLDKLPQQPEVVFVDCEELLPVQRVAPFTVAMIKNDESGDGHQYLLSGDKEHQDAIEKMQAALMPNVDYVEPFARLLEALKEATKSA